MSEPTPLPPRASGTVTVSEVRAWAGPVTVPDEVIESVIASETEAQGRVCDTGGDDTVDTIPEALHLALLRRVARSLAARGVALGVVGAESEYGSTSLPRYDAEIERLERPYRVVAIA